MTLLDHPPSTETQNRPGQDCCPGWGGVVRIRSAVGERGAAIVTALLVVALVTVIVSSLFYRESVAVRSIENRATLSQTRWIERAVIDWAKVILRNSPRDVDSSSSIWATPVVETQLDETVTGGAKIGDAERKVFLAGRIHDAQSRFNVNALLREGLDLRNPGGRQGGPGGQGDQGNPGGQGAGNQPGTRSEGDRQGTDSPSGGAQGRQDPILSAEHVQAMKRLMGLLSLPESLVDQILLRLRRVAAQNSGGQADSWVMPLVRLDDLRDLPGFTDEVMQKLEPHLTILPADARTVNVNSASVEVLSAMAPTWSQPSIRSFVANRDRLPAKTINDTALNIGGNTTLPATLVDVKSAYFLADGIIRYDRVESHTETLLNRSPTGQVKVIWQHRN